MNESVLITGALGGIGQTLCKVFQENGYDVIGVDINASTDIAFCNKTINMDLLQLVRNLDYREEKLTLLSEISANLDVVINNAAVQLLDSFGDIKLSEWEETLAVNLTAPMILNQWALPYLEKNRGSIINISSIHQKMTKPRFVSYATSKSALVGFTKAAAVDLNGKVRINSISPAAIETNMLRAGFDNDESALDKLRKIHPVQRIGHPEEVAELALFLSSKKAHFINGANLELDGGIGAVLKDL